MRGENRWSLGLVGVFVLGAAGCFTGLGAPAAGSQSHEAVGKAPPVERLRVEVLDAFPHDPEAFTQGLLLHGGWLYESTGLHGQSTLRQVDPATGEAARVVDLAPALFGEGLALVGDRLLQLTWQEEVALVYDLATLERVGEFRYVGEGWGLCYDGSRLVMSDGTNWLTFRDKQTFEILGRVAVTLEGVPVEGVNELECVGDDIYANVWLTDTILRIDAATGRVEATIDASGLLALAERVGADVLNGIAFDAERGRFLITGKLWPRLFEVHFVE